MTVRPDDRTVRAARQPVVRRSRQHRPSRAACRVSPASPGLPAGQEMHPLRGAPDEPALVLVEMARIPARLRPQWRRACRGAQSGRKVAESVAAQHQVAQELMVLSELVAGSNGWVLLGVASVRWRLRRACSLCDMALPGGQRRGESTPAGIIRQGVGGSAWSATTSARLTVHAGGAAETAWTGRDPTSRDGTPHRPTGNPARTSRFGGS